MGNYRVNEGPRDHAIRLGCEAGIFNFVEDYAKEMGMSMSGSVRRLLLIGARCESEHGHRPMPASYQRLTAPSEEVHDDFLEDKFDWGEDDNDNL